LLREASHENRAIHYIPELDGLRGIAIMAVVLFHARPEPASLFNPLPWLYTLLGLGPTGVDLFFVISGFLITSILMSTKGSTPRSYFWSFYARRTLRIFPLYFFAVAAFFYVGLPVLHNTGALLQTDRSAQIWYWTYLVNWNDAAGHIIPYVAHFWSLAVEEQFYLLWPAAVFFCAVRYFPALCVGLGAFSFLLRVILSTGHFMAPELLSEYLHRATITRLDTLAVGALIAAVVRNPEWTKLVRGQIKLITPAAFCAFLLIWLAGQQGMSFLMNTFGYLASAIAYGCVVFVCVTNHGGSHLLCRVARWRPLRSIGRYSYAIYIAHMFVNFYVYMAWTHTVLPQIRQIHGVEQIPPIAAALCYLGLNLGLSYMVGIASWHLFEKHFLQLKKYFPYQVSPRVSSELEIFSKAAGAD
jgi:peptidoglycan/LPS O-acetylase OafA/YrhL